MSSACSGVLQPSETRTTARGGAPADAGASTGGKGDATEARMKSDTRCDYDVDAIPTAEAGGDRCTFFIPPPPDDGTLSRESIAVVVDGVVIPQNVDAGWFYRDDTHALLGIAGPVCDAIQAGAVQMIWVHYHCSGII